MVSAIVCWNVGQAKLGHFMFFIEGRPLYRQHPTSEKTHAKQKLNYNHLQVQWVG